MRKLMTMKKTLMACVGVAWLGAICFEASRPVQASAPPAAAQVPAATGAASSSPARELVTRYCITCHNEKLKTAGLALEVSAVVVLAWFTVWLSESELPVKLVSPA